MKCRRCRKEQKDEDWRGLKTCPICHEKDLAYSRLKSEQRKQTHANVKSIEKYKFEEPMPKELTNFGENQIHWRALGQEVTYEDYEKDRNQWITLQVQKQSQSQIAQSQGQFLAKKKILMKFLRFDLFEPSNRDECTKYRLQKLGLWHEEENWLEEHKELCEECGHWLYNLENDILESKEGSFIHVTYASNFPPSVKEMISHEVPESFRKLMEKCPRHGCKMKLITQDDKLKKITLLCEPEPSREGYNEAFGHAYGNHPVFNYQAQESGSNGLQELLDEYDRQKKQRESS